MSRRRKILCTVAGVIIAGSARVGLAQSQPSAPAASSQPLDSGGANAPAGKLSFLPSVVSKDLDVNLWGWVGYLQEKSDEWDPYWDGELQLDINKSFGGRAAVTADVNFIDANDHAFGHFEQMFATVLVNESSGTMVTVGKFNASFGVEARDFWNRTTGTPSLLFGAQPQDLVGIMLTQPIGQTGIKVRPFIVNRFDGHFNFDQPPSAGITVDYRPDSSWRFAVTNWVGPGMVPPERTSEYAVGYSDSSGGEYTAKPATDAASSNEYSSSSNIIANNYLGPDFESRRGGTLYFVDANAVWLPRPDLTLSVEGMYGTTGSSDGRASWGGCMVLANYDVTDRLRVWGRWSYLNDAAWMITGSVQRRHELSAGIGYEIYHNVEVRTEYRHDFSTTEDDVDSLSVHLSFGI